MLFGNGFVRWILLTVFSAVGICSAACPVGDLNGDCQVDLQDLALFAGQWLETPNCAGLPCADLDGSDGVNLADLAVFSQNWGMKSYPILINEYMSSNHTTIEDPDEPGEYPDWIELYNFGSKAVDIGGCWVSDDPAIAKKFLIPYRFSRLRPPSRPADFCCCGWTGISARVPPISISSSAPRLSEFVGLSDPSGNPIDSLDTIPLTERYLLRPQARRSRRMADLRPVTQSNPNPRNLQRFGRG